MARQKRTSTDLDDAKTRATALATVDKTMDFGNGVSLAELNTQTAALESQLATYNQELSKLDDKANKLDDAEAAVAELASRLLGGVKTKYGPDSSEYEMAGGTRTSERAKPGPKTKPAKPA